MTQLLLVITLVTVLAIVLVLVGYLLAIIWALWSAGTNLEKLADGLIAIRDNTKPLPGDISTINGTLSKLLKGLLGVNGNLVTIADVAQDKR